MPDRDPTRSAIVCGVVAAAVPVVFLPYTFDPFALPKQLLLVVLVALAAGFAVREGGTAIPGGRHLWALVAALAFAEALSFAASVDRLGSITGSYGYRFGILTHFALLALLVVTMFSVRSNRAARAVLGLGGGGCLLVIAYALSQSLGLDPFDWRDGGSRSVFSAMGNPNDLAGYCVLSLSFAALSYALTGWRRRSALAVSVLAVAVVVIETGSRSGLVAVGVAMLAMPVLAWVNGWQRHAVGELSGVLGAVVLAAIVVAVASGRAEALGQRFSAAFSQGAGETASFRTRVDLWKGAVAVARQHPLFGTGQDGLMVEFNRYRPADLGPLFSQPSATGRDPLVGSPHSAPLEIVVTMGTAGSAIAGTILVLVLRRYWRILRRVRSNELPFLGAAIAGFTVVAVLNPLNVANAALLTVLLGIVLGLTGDANVPSRRQAAHTRLRSATAGVALVLFGGGVILSGVYLQADREAYKAVKSDASGDADAGLKHARRAASVLPFERAYRRQEVVAAVNVALVHENPVLMSDAQHKAETFLSDFPGVADDFLLLAQIRAAANAPGVEEALAAAREASPHGADTAMAIARIEGSGSSPAGH